MERVLPSLSKKVASKTFVFDSSDGYISEVLREHGWTQVSKHTNAWHLKWVWKTDLKEIQSLHSKQMINHFANNDDLTTKIGLYLLLKRNHQLSNDAKPYSWFYPRSYNLCSEKEEFLKDFLRTGVFNLLKKIVASLELFHNQQHSKIKSRRVKIEDSHKYLKSHLSQQTIFSEQSDQKLRVNGSLFLRLLFYMEHLFSLDFSYHFHDEQLLEMGQYAQEQIPFSGPNLECPSDAALSLLMAYHQKCLASYPAYFQDGFGNIWIVKSNYSSRGRSIQIVDNLDQIHSLSNGMKLIQKYIENVWVLHSLSEEQAQAYPFMQMALGRKFDIRFWVLVKSFYPLQVYFYKEGYLRLSSQNYQLDCLMDECCHLTNYSTNWRKSKLKQLGGETSFILYSQFSKFLEEVQGVNTKQLQQKIKDIFIQTLRSTDFKQNAQCFQLLGFDIILDAHFNPWLLQCNLSPSCSPRGRLKTIAKEMAEGMFSLVGLVKGPINQWSLLVNEQKHKNRQKLKNKANIFQSDLGKNRTSQSSTQISWTKQPLLIHPLKWNKYKQIQRAHYILQKVVIIQQFYKKRFILIKKESYPSCSRTVKMLETLSKILRRIKRKKLRLFVRRVTKTDKKVKTQSK